MMKNSEFFLASREGYNLDMPRSCKTVKRLRSETRDDLLLVKIDPPLIGQQYGLGGNDLDMVVIATRHKGASLFPISEWPLPIYIVRYIPGDPDGIDSVRENDLEIIAWAELYQTEEAAIEAIRKIKGD